MQDEVETVHLKTPVQLPQRHEPSDNIKPRLLAGASIQELLWEWVQVMVQYRHSYNALAKCQRVQHTRQAFQLSEAHKAIVILFVLVDA